MRASALVIALQAFFLLGAIPRSADAQDTPVSSPATQQATQSTSPASSTSAQAPAPAKPKPDDALDNPVIEQADEEQSITYLKSHVTFKYNHDEYDEGSSGNRERIDWQQSFGPSGRMAAGIELPFVQFSGNNGEPSGNGLGDIVLKFRGMLGKGEKFENAAGIEITVPSATNYQIGENETVIKVVWGFSAQVTPRTLLSGELAYNKAVQTSHRLPGTNSIQPELILSHAFAKRAGGYLDWDTYYDFSASAYSQLLKVGLEFELDRNEKWSLAPYLQFPLNHFTRII